MSEADALQIGDVLLVGPRLWRVTRFTPKRAYVKAVQGVSALPTTDQGQRGTGLHVHGTSHVGYFLEYEYDFHKKNIAEYAIKLRHGIDDDEIRVRALRSFLAMRPHADRVRALLQEVTDEQAQEHAVRRLHLTEPLGADATA